MKVMERVGVLVGCVFGFSTGAMAFSQAGGYNERQAWSSLQGPLFVTHYSAGPVLWWDDNRQQLRWNLFINAAGLYGEPPAGSRNEDSGSFSLDQAAVTGFGWPVTLTGMLQIDWGTISNANFYTNVLVRNCQITNQDLFFGPNEDNPGTWQAGVWVQGIVAPECSTVALLLAGILWLRPRKREVGMRNGIVLLMGAAFLVGAPPVWATTIANDRFESASLVADGWTTVGGNWKITSSSLAAHGGTSGADVQGNTDPDDDVMSKTFSSVGFQGIRWNYWYKVRDGLESTDHLYAEWSPDGSIWNGLADYTSLATGDWQEATFALPAQADNNANLVFRFRARLSATTDRMHIDDGLLIGTLIPEPGAVILMALGFVLFFQRSR